jgi:hypothetical protein
VIRSRAAPCVEHRKPPDQLTVEHVPQQLQVAQVVGQLNVRPGIEVGLEQSCAHAHDVSGNEAGGRFHDFKLDEATDKNPTTQRFPVPA